MSELSQEESLEFLKEIFESARTCGYGSDKDIQAYEQLKSRIEQRLRVSKSFIGKVSARIYCDRKNVYKVKAHVLDAFIEAGFEVEE